MRFFLFFSFIIIVACQSSSEQQDSKSVQAAFLETLEQDSSIQDFFWRQGGLFTQQQIYKNRDSIEFYCQMLKNSSFESIKVIQHDSSNYFELGCYYNATNQDSTLSLIAWKKDSLQWVKELEVLSPITIQQPVPEDSIKAALQAWEDLSNQHQHAQLVQQLYAPHGFYFNDGYIYQGIPAITEKYAYMSKPKWHIRLSTIQSLQATDSLYYDVGQYVSSGRGHYFILWQLQASGQWQVLLDFNF